MQSVSINELYVMKKIVIILVSLQFIALQCNRKEPGAGYMKLNGEALGTTFNIQYENVHDKNYYREIDSLFELVNNSLSTYRPGSVISRINRGDTGVVVDSFFIEVFSTAKKVWKKTGGSFDITVAPLVNAWGFGFTEKSEIDSSLIDSLLSRTGFENVALKERKVVKTKPGIMLDANAIAKGYCVDVLAEFIEKQDIENYLVEVGGEIRTKGKNSRGGDWIIGIDKPVDNNQVPGANLQAKVALSGKSLATSGNYRRFYVKDGIKYAHTINPETGWPVNHNLLSASVIADRCITADAYATAFMVKGLDESIKLAENLPGVEAYFIYSDNKGDFKVHFTEGFKELIKE